METNTLGKTKIISCENQKHVKHWLGEKCPCRP